MQTVTERKHFHGWWWGIAGERRAGSGRSSWDPKSVTIRHRLPGVMGPQTQPTLLQETGVPLELC